MRLSDVFMRSKTVQQVAALPFVITADGIEVLLITSRRRGRWILPKGWSASGLTLAKAAAREAFEEAGVRGIVDDTPLGTYRYAKRMPAGYDVSATVFVYPLLVIEHRLDWREKPERQIAWYPLAAAARLVDDRGLARLLSRLARGGGQKLKAFTTGIGDAGLVSVSEDA
jgi:8-oxo-dGTP pyrophosphatase MutT (NUDIX family)